MTFKNNVLGLFFVLTCNIYLKERRLFKLETLMSLDKLSSSLTDAIKKLFKAGVVDEAAVKELVRDIQRALFQADVNVQLVLRHIQTHRGTCAQREGAAGHLETRTRNKSCLRRINPICRRQTRSHQDGARQKKNHHARRHPRLRQNHTGIQAGTVLSKKRFEGRLYLR